MGVVRFASSFCCGAVSSRNQAAPPSADELEQTSSGNSMQDVPTLDMKTSSIDSQEQIQRRASRRSSRSEMSRTLSEHISHRQGEDVLVPTLCYPAGEPMTKSNAFPDLIVVRGKDWRWGDEDGGAGRPGRILSVDRRTGTIVVHWQSSGLVETHYRFGKRGCCDLAMAEGWTNADSTQSKMLAMFRRTLSNRAPARNSQTGFADKGQTVIIFDWDDTLFPSTFVRSDAKLNLTRPLRDQKLSAQQRKAVFNSLAACANKAERLLRLACSYGKVVVVTLARSPWVDESCKLFYARMGSLMRQLQVRVVYAQERCKIEGRKAPSAMTASEAESFWSAIKGRAIEDEVKRFYSKYEGQSWKNIISIGDSNFERLGTMKAAATYMRDKGIDVPAALDDTIRNGLVNNASVDHGKGFQPSEACPVVVEGQNYHVRIKVMKMVEEPTVEELTVELGLVQQWLPLMVQHDGGFTVDLAGVQNWDQAQAIEDSLRARPAPAMTRIASADIAGVISGRSGGSDESMGAAESYPSAVSRTDESPARNSRTSSQRV